MKLLTTFSFLLLLFAQSAHASLLINGSFESDFTGWTATPLPNGNIVTTGLEGTTDGVLAAVFNSGDKVGAILSQAINTIIGTTYQLNFDAGVFGAARQHSLALEINGNSLITNDNLNLTGPGSFSSSNTTFNTYSYNFIADSTSTTIRFTDNTTLNNSVSADTVLDNISVNAVPAPAVILLLATGFLVYLPLKNRSIL